MKHWRIIVILAVFAAATVAGFSGCLKHNRSNPWMETNYRVQMGDRDVWYKVDFQFAPNGKVRWRKGVVANDLP